MVATLNNANHLKSGKHTRRRRHTHILGKQPLSAWQLSYLWLAFYTENADFECLKCYHPAITIWMETNKMRKYANISSAVQKVLISDKIKTQCDQWASLQASSKWTAFLHWLLNFLCHRPFLLLQYYHCSGVVINNGLGVYVARLQLHAPLILVLPSEQAWTTHPTSLMLSWGRPVWENQDIHNAWLQKRQFNTNRNHSLYHSSQLPDKIHFSIWGRWGRNSFQTDTIVQTKSQMNQWVFNLKNRWLCENLV